jgi:hypothetical protein
MHLSPDVWAAVTPANISADRCMWSDASVIQITDNLVWHPAGPNLQQHGACDRHQQRRAATAGDWRLLCWRLCSGKAPGDATGGVLQIKSRNA